MRTGALEDEGFKAMLYEKLQVFEEMPSFSIHDMFGKILPGAPGLVGCCYRLAPGYPMVDYYYTRVPMPEVRDLADLGLYSGVSLVKDRKAKSSSAAAAAAEGTEDGEEAEEEAKAGGQLLLKENENSLHFLGVAVENLIKTSTAWRGAFNTALADRNNVPLVRKGYKKGQCLGDNWIAMDDVTTSRLLLPSRTMVFAFLSGGQPERIDSPAEPMTVPPSSLFAAGAASFAGLVGGSEKGRMDKRVTVGELFVHLTDVVDGLVPLTAEGLGQDLVNSYDAVIDAVCTGRLKQRKKELTLPEKPVTAFRLFYEERKQYHQHGVQGARAGDAAAQEEDEEEEEDDSRFSGAPGKLHAHILQEWSEFKAAQGGGTGHYGETFMKQKWELRRAHENWLRAYHTTPPPPPPWSAEAKAEIPQPRGGGGRGGQGGGGRGRGGRGGRGRGAGGGGGGGAAAAAAAGAAAGRGGRGRGAGGGGGGGGAAAAAENHAAQDALLAAVSSDEDDSDGYDGSRHRFKTTKQSRAARRAAREGKGR